MILIHTISVVNNFENEKHLMEERNQKSWEGLEKKKWWNDFMKSFCCIVFVFASFLPSVVTENVLIYADDILM